MHSSHNPLLNAPTLRPLLAVVYCDSHRCSDSYELLHDCEYVECEDRICDDSQCCMHGEFTFSRG